MNKLGVNLFLWTTTMDEELSETFAFLKNTGYDFVEVPVMDTDLAKWQRIGKQLDAVGLDRVACVICGPEFSLISAEASVRQAAVERLKRIIDSAKALGASMLTGPFHSGFKTFTGKPATEQEWNCSVEGMRQVADYAARQGIVLGLEYLNRFENYFLTSADELIRYVEAVDHPACRLMYDTFHAHIEEKNQPEAIRRCAPYLVHVQISENDRSTPGSGQVDFTAIFNALQEINYQGPICVEAFGLTPPDLAAAAHIVRRMFESPEQLVGDAYELFSMHAKKFSLSE
ncbi:sugar phosphate isomerase/epimerase family protein [Tellurirhabdus rosea]|uniref:sugar phosphate isomerase/epimerase family protein n=1 Tax=Tellurirhabdus rosea TaxID=2674997 RepID=UPI0022567C74|nr:sugar phosphate isomerase/epimerase family protein [Tellurirhabdus rosea]